MPLPGLLTLVLLVLPDITPVVQDSACFFLLKPHTQYPCLVGDISTHCHLTQVERVGRDFGPPRCSHYSTPVNSLWHLCQVSSAICTFGPLWDLPSNLNQSSPCHVLTGFFFSLVQIISQAFHILAMEEKETLPTYFIKHLCISPFSHC